MHNYSCVFFDLFNTLIHDNSTAERDKFRLDNIYTILEKSLYPVKFGVLQEKYGEMMVFTAEQESAANRSFTPFQQVEYLLKLLKINNIIVFKKVYDTYIDAVLQLSPKMVHNADKALEHLKEKNVKIGLISNTIKSSGFVLRILLKQLNLYDYFDDMVFSDEIGFIKPSQFIFDMAVWRLGVDRKNSIFIGDLKSIDQDGAVKAGL